MNTPAPQRRALLRNMIAATIATTLSVGALAALPAASSTPFQIPERPDLQVSWLKSVSLSRQLVPAGQEITGTITLKRAACVFHPIPDAIPLWWRKAFRIDGGRCSSLIADTGKMS